MADESMTGDDLALWAIELVENGSTLKNALKTVGLSNSAFNRALSRVRDHAIRYSRARELNADILVDEAIEIADSDIDPQIARNRIDIRKWVASKHKPKIYGDRIDLTVSQTISVSEARSEAQARLSGLPDLPVIDAQLVPLAQLVMDNLNENNS